MLKAKLGGELRPIPMFHRFYSALPIRRRLALAAMGTLLLAASLIAWLLLPSGFAQAQDGVPTASCTAKIEPGNPATEDDVAITDLRLPQGAAISPSFHSDTLSYALTVPTALEQLNFSCRFIPPYGDYEKVFGFIAVGTKDELEKGMNRATGVSHGLAIVNSQRLYPQGRAITLNPLGSTTTVEIRVYKKRHGRVHSFPPTVRRTAYGRSIRWR